MNILFVTRAGGVDYQSDAVFHGLVTLGHNVTDNRYMWYLSDTITEEGRSKQWGKGFSIAGKLPDRSGIPRDDSDIVAKIRDRYYDAIIYGDIWRSLDYFDIVTRCYPKKRIAFIDGEDGTFTCPVCEASGLYFKRELLDPKGRFPISFALPPCQFDRCGTPESKTLDVASLVPGCRETYVYKTEEEYYDGYRKARFAFTWKKRGWDCFRHYEIVAAGCIPIFTDLPYMPGSIMTTWPKHLQWRANYIGWKWISGSKDEKGYASLLSEFVSWGKSKMTTPVLANYVLDKMFN